MYTAYHLTIDSELPLPELPTTDSAAADITIRLGQPPDHLDAPTYTGLLHESAPGHLLYSVPSVLRLLARAGNEILVEPQPGSDPDSVRAFVLTAGLAAIMHQRGRMALRGSAVAIDGQAVIFTGISGAGKSTLAAALYRRGYRLLADDFVVIDLDADGQPVVTPGYPVLKVWKYALLQLGYDQDSIAALTPVRPALQKYMLPAERGFSPAPAPVRGIYALQSAVDREGPRVPLPALNMLQILNWHFYYRRFAIDLGAVARCWPITTALTDHAASYRLWWRWRDFNAETLADLVVADGLGAAGEREHS
ncbi:MAG: hypothetical protein GYB67_07555 [Chloroflexi bacterium]|nr:hypothetical protein [Chloroflexota bacterium]